MDKKQKLAYQKGIEQYLQQENVYDLFEDLLKSLVVKQPDDPISYLIEKLSNPESQSIISSL
jgi:adenylate kinase